MRKVLAKVGLEISSPGRGARLPSGAALIRFEHFAEIGRGLAVAIAQLLATDGHQYDRVNSNTATYHGGRYFRYRESFLTKFDCWHQDVFQR